MLLQNSHIVSLYSYPVIMSLANVLEILVHHPNFASLLHNKSFPFYPMWMRYPLKCTINILHYWKKSVEMHTECVAFICTTTWLTFVCARVVAAPSHDDGLQRLTRAACCPSDPPSAVAQRNSAHHCFSRLKHGYGHACTLERRHSCTSEMAQTLLTRQTTD